MNELNIYFSFITYAIVGKMAEADQMLGSHEAVILECARKLLRKTAYGEIHRGVILSQSGLSYLKPEWQRRFISFSENHLVAKNFADSDPKSGFGFGGMGLGEFGYTIRCLPAPSEVLFHHSLLQYPGINKMVSDGIALLTGLNGDEALATLISQEEVILLNTGQIYHLVPFVKDSEYTSWVLKKRSLIK
jgi:hypothetical protein